VPVFKLRRFEQNKGESLMSTTIRCVQKLDGLSMQIRPAAVDNLKSQPCKITAGNQKSV
jgi:hypothetical protein